VTSCFPGLEGEQVKEIKEMFVGEFAKTWNIADAEIAGLQAAVTAKLPQYLQDFVQSASTEHTPPSGRSRSDSGNSAEHSDASAAGEAMALDASTAAMLKPLSPHGSESDASDMEVEEAKKAAFNHEHPSHVAQVLADASHKEHNYLLRHLIERDILAHPKDDDFEVFKAHMRTALETANHPDQSKMEAYMKAIIRDDRHPYNQALEKDHSHTVGGDMQRSMQGANNQGMKR